MSLTQSQIAAMEPVELLARCAAKLGVQSSPGFAWDGTIGDAWGDLLQWILRPILGDVNPRYAVCDDASPDIVSEWALMNSAITNAGLGDEYQTWQEGCRAALAAWSGV